MIFFIIILSHTRGITFSRPTQQSRFNHAIATGRAFRRLKPIQPESPNARKTDMRDIGTTAAQIPTTIILGLPNRFEHA
jgi:hypothetical protein